MFFFYLANNSFATLIAPISSNNLEYNLQCLGCLVKLLKARNFQFQIESNETEMGIKFELLEKKPFQTSRLTLEKIKPPTKMLFVIKCLLLEQKGNQKSEKTVTSRT